MIQWLYFRMMAGQQVQDDSSSLALLASFSLGFRVMCYRFEADLRIRGRLSEQSQKS